MKGPGKPIRWSQLTYERKRRNWTQEELAEKVGVAPITVSRWERGTALPNPYYCRRLCEIFEKKSIEELGLVRKETEPAGEQQPGQAAQEPVESTGQQHPGPPSHQPHQHIEEYRIQKLSLLDHLKIILARPTEGGNLPLSARDRLEDAYRKLLAVSQARLDFAATVEAIRRYNGDIPHERLPREAAGLEAAEQAFDEDDAWRTLALLDNDKVWAHYSRTSEAFKKYRERTKGLVEEAMKPLSPLQRRIFRIDVLLSGDDSLDDDPETRRTYKEMQKEAVAMLKAMNKRLRV
jgi:transcriptional regulator with XRE-family HTH domain